MTAMAAEGASVTSPIAKAAAKPSVAAVRPSMATRIAVPAGAAVATVGSAVTAGMTIAMTLSGGRI